MISLWTLVRNADASKKFSNAVVSFYKFLKVKHPIGYHNKFEVYVLFRSDFMAG